MKVKNQTIAVSASTCWNEVYMCGMCHVIFIVMHRFLHEVKFAFCSTVKFNTSSIWTKRHLVRDSSV